MPSYQGYNVHVCPYCGFKTCEPAQMSGNTFGARYRSDTYIREPMGFDRRILARCPKCEKYHRLSNAKWLDVDTPPFPLLRKTSKFWEIQKALEQLDADGKLTPETERVLRLRLLWELNGFRPPPGLVPAADANRTALLELVEPNAYLRVELLRELGEFRAAAKLIRSVPESDGWFGALPQIRKAISAKLREAFWLAP